MTTARGWGYVSAVNRLLCARALTRASSRPPTARCWTKEHSKEAPFRRASALSFVNLSVGAVS
jgi:hypothetical protein